MELFSDKPGLAAVALTRLAAAEAEGRGQLAGRLQVFLQGLLERNGPGAVEQLAIELARQHLATLDNLSALSGRPAFRHLDEVELRALESTWEKGAAAP